MKKRHIFFDFDGMKFDTLPAQVAFINQHFEIKTQLSEHIGNGNRLEMLVRKHTGDESITREQVYDAYGKHFLPSIEWHEDVKPMDNAPEIIKLLAEENIIHSVTARQKVGIVTIQYLLDKYMPNCIENIHCVGQKDNEGKSFKISKKEYIQSIIGKKVVFFDDSIDEINDTQSVIPSFLFDPNNFHPEIPILHKVTSFHQIGKMLLGSRY